MFEDLFVEIHIEIAERFPKDISKRIPKEIENTFLTGIVVSEKVIHE